MEEWVDRLVTVPGSWGGWKAVDWPWPFEPWSFWPFWEETDVGKELVSRKRWIGLRGGVRSTWQTSCFWRVRVG